MALPSGSQSSESFLFEEVTALTGENEVRSLLCHIYVRGNDTSQADENQRILKQIGISYHSNRPPSSQDC